MLNAVEIKLQIMMKIKCINTIRLHYIIDDLTKDSLYLSIESSLFGQVMDFDGKLLKYIPNKYVNKNKDHENNNWDIMETGRKLFMDSVKCIQHLHDLNVIPKDIKRELRMGINKDTQNNDNDNRNECGIDTQGTYHFKSSCAISCEKRNAFMMTYGHYVLILFHIFIHINKMMKIKFINYDKNTLHSADFSFLFCEPMYYCICCLFSTTLACFN